MEGRPMTKGGENSVQLSEDAKRMAKACKLMTYPEAVDVVARTTGLNTRGIAELLGLHESVLSKRRNGKQDPTREALIFINLAAAACLADTQDLTAFGKVLPNAIYRDLLETVAERHKVSIEDAERIGKQRARRKKRAAA
jgi:hypothetical protein